MPINRPPPARPAVLSEPEAQDSIIDLSNGDKLDVSWVSEHTGVPVEYFKKILNIENPKHNPEAKNKSGASGLFQVKDRTWLSIIKEYRNAMIDSGGNPVIPEDLTSDEDLLGLKNNPKINAHVTGQLAKELKSNLTKVLGREISNEEIYMGHLLGQPSATKFLKKLDKDQADNRIAGPRRDYTTLSSDVFGGTSIIKGNPKVFMDGNKERNNFEVMNFVTQELNKDDIISGGSGRDLKGGTGTELFKMFGTLSSDRDRRSNGLGRLTPTPTPIDYDTTLENIITDLERPIPGIGPPLPGLINTRDRSRPDAAHGYQSPRWWDSPPVRTPEKVARANEAAPDWSAGFRHFGPVRHPEAFRVARPAPLPPVLPPIQREAFYQPPLPDTRRWAHTNAPSVTPPPLPRRGIEYGRDRDDPSIGGPFMGEVRNPSIIQRIWESLQTPSTAVPQRGPGIASWRGGR